MRLGTFDELKEAFLTSLLNARCGEINFRGRSALFHKRHRIRVATNVLEVRIDARHTGFQRQLTLTSSDSPTEDASFTVVSPGVVRVAFKTDGMAGQVTKDQDEQTAAMMKQYFEGHTATIRVKGKKITDTNMTLSADGTSSELVIPFTALFDGTAKLPPELYAVVDTN